MSLAGAASSAVKFTARPNDFLLIRARSCSSVICPVEGGAWPTTSPPQPVARIRAAVNLQLDQIRRVPLHYPLGTVHHPCSPSASPEIFSLKCIAPQLVSTITNPYFSFPPLQQLSSTPPLHFFSLNSPHVFLVCPEG